MHLYFHSNLFNFCHRTTFFLFKHPPPGKDPAFLSEPTLRHMILHGMRDITLRLCIVHALNGENALTHKDPTEWGKSLIVKLCILGWMVIVKNQWECTQHMGATCVRIRTSYSSTLIRKPTDPQNLPTELLHFCTLRSWNQTHGGAVVWLPHFNSFLD